MEPSITTEPGTLLKGRWQWQSNPNPWDKKETPRWKSYPLEHDYLIEKAYYEKKHEVDIGDHIVSIKHMIQKKKGSIVSQRSIRRIDWTDDDVHEKDRSQRYLETEIPKTINKVFGSLNDFLSFFSRRNPEILEFTKDFKDLETSNDLDILNNKIVPKLIDCLEEVLVKPNEKQLQDSSLSKLRKKLLLKMKERIEEMISLFKKESLSLEEFYGRILRAYTMDTDLYPMLNNYLRNENWVKVDQLLPYAFCLCKAFFNRSFTKDPAQENKTPSSMLLYRGTALDESSLSFYNTDVQSFSWNSVTSATKAKEIAEEFMYKNADLANKKYPVLFVIEVPLAGEFESESLKWIDIQQYSVIPREDEVVLPPGSVFELQEIITDQNEITTIKIKLRNEIKSLAHGGMIMQGALQSQMTTEKEAKIMCLEGEELNQALVSLKGNKLIGEVEFSLCTFDKKLLRKMLEILPTLERGKILKFIACNSEDNGEVTDEGPIEGESCEITKLEVIGASKFLKVICNDKWDQKYWLALREFALDFSNRRSLKDEELEDEVSQWLKYLPQLASLNINFESSNITDGGVDILARSLNFFTRLVSLNLNFAFCSFITDDCVNSLARSLNSLTNLAHLNLSFESCEQITNEAANSLARSLTSLTQLTYLKINFLDCKQITCNGVNILASQGFQSLSQLKFLNLGFLVSSGLKNVFQGIGYLTQLISLTLRSVFYDDKELNSFVCDGLKRLLQLTSLTLLFWQKTGKEITDKGLEVLAYQGLKPLLFLTSLGLTFNSFHQISDKGVESLASQGFQHLTQLRSFVLKFNFCDQISDKGVESLASQGFQHLTQLKSFVLKLNFCDQITDEGVNSLMFQGLKNLTQLISLTLDFTNCSSITEKGMKTLASKWLRKLPIFNFLAIRNCSLYTINIQTRQQQLTNSRRLRLARESYQKYKQFLDKEFSGLKMIPNSSKSLKQSEKQNSKDLLNKLIPILKKNEDRTHDPQSTLTILEIFPEIRYLTSLNLHFKDSQSTKTDKFVHSLASQVLRHSHQLRFLTLSFYDSGITDKGVGDLALYGLKSLTALASLTLDFGSIHSAKLTNKGVRDLVLHGLNSLENLVSLDLNFTHCHNITDKGMMNLACEGLRHLSQLKSLALKFVFYNELTNEGWAHLAWNGLRHLFQLESLVLKPCQRITDKGVNSLISQGLKYLTQLKSLSFDFSHSEITDKGVNNFILQVVKNLPQLTSLDLGFGYTENIRDFTIQNVTKVLHYFGFTKEIDEITKSNEYEIEETDEYEISFFQGLRWKMKKTMKFKLA